MKRQYTSGSAKRIAKTEKDKLFGEVVCKTQRLDQLWAPKAPTLDNSVADGRDSESSESDDHSESDHAVESQYSGAVDSDSDSTHTSGELDEETARVTFPSDLGKWPSASAMNNEMRDFWIAKGSSDCQHTSGPFVQSAQRRGKTGNRQRFCTRALFSRIHVNGETVNRNWLCYSSISGKVYCFMCKLICVSEKGSPFANEGFIDWKHGERAIATHENSVSHRESMIAVTTRGSTTGRIDSQLMEACESERRNVLSRVVAVVTFLAERGLPFRGHDEVIGSHANGNYLGIMELLSQFDPFLARHIERHGKKGRGHTSYLSSTICDEFITLMGEEVLKRIVKELSSAKYFSVTVDSTPDISHVDQLTCCAMFCLMGQSSVLLAFSI